MIELMYTYDLSNESFTKKRIQNNNHPKLIDINKGDSNSILFPTIETNNEERIKQLFLLNCEKINFSQKIVYESLKRMLDITFCILIAPLALFLIFLFGILIKIDSSGPAFYKQIRSGRYGDHFIIFKLRSMVNEAEKNNGAQWAIKNDPRITTIGKIIRKTRIDELPQLWNIFKGEMSLIGPRPERPELILEFSENHPLFIARNAVRPGITGWAQVNGGYELSPKEKITYDLYYLKNRGITLDLYILVKTIGVVLTGKGAY